MKARVMTSYNSQGEALNFRYSEIEPQDFEMVMHGMMSDLKKALHKNELAGFKPAGGFMFVEFKKNEQGQLVTSQLYHFTPDKKGINELG